VTHRTLQHDSASKERRKITFCNQLCRCLAHCGLWPLLSRWLAQTCAVAAPDETRSALTQPAERGRRVRRSAPPPTRRTPRPNQAHNPGAARPATYARDADDGPIPGAADTPAPTVAELLRQVADLKADKPSQAHHIAVQDAEIADQDAEIARQRKIMTGQNERGRGSTQALRSRSGRSPYPSARDRRHFAPSGSTVSRRVKFSTQISTRATLRRGGCRCYIPCGDGLSFTREGGLRFNLPGWSCGFDSHHPLQQLSRIFRTF